MKQAIQVPNAPAPIAPYSPAILAGNLLFISGQIPINPDTQELVLTDIKAQTHQVMRNLHALLVAANADWANVLKVSIFMTDMQDYAAINEVYGSYFAGIVPPAREAVQVAALPRYVNVEISLIAMIA